MRTAAAKGAPRPHGLMPALAVVMLASAFVFAPTATAAAAGGGSACASSASGLTAAATGATYEARYKSVPGGQITVLSLVHVEP